MERKPALHPVAEKRFGYRYTLSDRIHDALGMSTIGGIAIAAFCVVWFGGQLIRGWLS